MPDLRPFVTVQLLLTLFVVVLLWCFQARLRKQEFFRLWAWAWAAYGVFLLGNALARPGPDGWTLVTGAAALLASVAGFLQVPLLVFGAASLRPRAKPLSPVRFLGGLAAAAAAGLLTFVLAASGMENRLVAEAWRAAPRALALAGAWGFCGWVLFARWREDRGAAGVLAASCAVYAADHALYALAFLVHLGIAGQGWLPRALLMRPETYFLDLACTLGICLGMALMLLDRHDHAERALLESAAVRQSEERYRALVLASAQVVWRTTADGVATSVTPAWQSLTGQTDEEMRGDGWLEAVHPDDRERAIAAWRQARAEGRPYENDLRVRGRDGSYRHFLSRGVPVHGLDGRIREWVGANTDITERTAAETALREGERRYRLATDAGDVGVWDLDLDTGEMYIDPRLKAILGFDDGEIRNHLDDWILRVYAGDLDLVQAALDAHLAGATPNYEVEHRMVHKDGSLRWFLARGRLLPSTDGRRRVVGTDTDVTARRATEDTLREVQARHRAILRALPDMMFLQDRGGVYLDAHARHPSDFLLPPESFLGRNMHDVLPPELVGRFAACFEDAMRSGGPSTFEYDLQIRGELRHWESRIVRCDQDKVLSIVRDITPSKRSENEARALRDELAHVGRVSLLSTLTGSIAHEINQPLAAIMANASAALRLTNLPEPDVRELREALRDIVEDGRRAGEVLRRLRALLTKETSEHRAVDLTTTLDEVLMLVRSDAVGRRISLEVNVAPQLPPVRGDRVQLQQVMLNLLLNAFEAVRDLDVPDRRVQLEAAGEADGQVILSVVDRGMGVTDDELPRIFEPFYTTKRGGMGLGLPICQTIAGAHGGALKAERNSNGGMRFSLMLPGTIPPPLPEAGEQPRGALS